MKIKLTTRKFNKNMFHILYTYNLCCYTQQCTLQINEFMFDKHNITGIYVPTYTYKRKQTQIRIH